MFGRLPGLTHLYVQGHDFGPDGERTIAEELARSSSRLVWLSLPQDSAGDAGAEALAVALPRWPHLKMLWLSSNGIGDAGATRLADALRSGCSTALTGLLLCGGGGQSVWGSGGEAALGGAAVPAVLPEHWVSLTDRHAPVAARRPVGQRQGFGAVRL